MLINRSSDEHLTFREKWCLKVRSPSLVDVSQVNPKTFKQKNRNVTPCYILLTEIKLRKFENSHSGKKKKNYWQKYIT